MKRRLLWALTATGALVLLYFLLMRRHAPPEVPFTKVVRESVVSALTTNGKVEPLQWASARTEVAGLVSRIETHRGQKVVRGTPLVQLDSVAAQSEVAAAQARVGQVQADLETLRQGGRSTEIATLGANLDAAKQELAAAQRDYDALQRLQAKNAATGAEVNAARERLERAQVQIRGLEQRRTSLVSQPERSAAEARLREAQASVAAARGKMGMLVVRAPIAGTVYQFDLKPGAFLNPGDLVANIGKLEAVRVIVYVDEPDLGRVEVGMPVNITWDALPARRWTGLVERKPSQVVALGTRQVGEVSCIIGNPDLDLLPGTNVNAEIRSQVVQNALTIPNASLRREGERTGVFLLADGRIVWREVKLGVASVVRSQVLSGLQEGDSIALPSDRALKNNMAVSATYP